MIVGHHASSGLSAAYADGGLLAVARRAATLAGPWTGQPLGEQLERALARVEDQALNVVVAGQFKRGKTTLIDALVGADVLPRAVVPATSVITLVRHGRAIRVAVEFDDGRRREIASAELADFVTEDGNPRNARGVRTAVVEVPSELLRDGITLVDTPGTASVYVHGTEVARGFLPEADAALFVLSVDPPVSADELDDLAAIRARVPAVICVLNKVDQFPVEDVATVLSFTRRQLDAAGLADVPVVAASAKQALEARQAGDAAELAASGLPGLEAQIRSRVADRRRALGEEGVRRRALDVLDAAIASIRLERRSIDLGEAEARSRLRRFQEVAAAVRQAGEQETLVVSARAGRVVTEEVPERLAALAAATAREIDELLVARSPRSEQEGRSIVEPALMAAVAAWVEEMRTLLDTSVAPVLADSVGRVNALRVRALADAASIFELAAPPAHAMAGEVAPSGAGLLRLRDEPTGGLELAVAGGRRLLPGGLGRRATMRALRTWAAETVDRHSGRLRAEVVRAVDEALRTAARSQAEALDGTLRLIERAVARASTRVEGTREGDERRASQRRDLDDALEGLRRALAADR